MIDKYLRIYSNRFISRWLVLLIDLTIVAVAFVCAKLIRYNFDILAIDLPLMFNQGLLLLSLCFIAFLITKSYSGIIRHTGIEDAVKLFFSVTAVTAVLFLSHAVMYALQGPASAGKHVFSITISTLVINYLLCLFFLIASRFIFKALYQSLFEAGKTRVNVLIFGAGRSGTITRSTLLQDDTLRYHVVGFIDDNPSKINKSVQGIRVYASDVLNADFLDKKQVKEVILAIQNISGPRKREIIDQCLLHNIKVKNVPPIQSWINGELSSKQIKSVKIEDLLQREEIVLDNQNISSEIFEKVVLVTGAAGSIGSEIARQLMHYQPAQLILLDQGESPMYELQLELRKNFGHLMNNVQFIIADVSNEKRMRMVFKKYRPSYVFHAAAYKHVPLMEENSHEAVRVNIFGTQLLADLSVEFGVSKFVMVSTDKAVNPTNVMGASKRVAEIYIQSLNNAFAGNTRFVTTRFGNVLGSNGSVIPLFRRQIEAGGPITVTHPDITRYFMTIPEACQLVLEAGVMGKGGEIFIFDMGESVRILDVAKKMIKLSGLTLGKDIQITFTGLRPGEKLYEELLNVQENTIPTHHPKIMIGKVRQYDFDQVAQQLVMLRQMSNTLDAHRVVAKIKEIVPEFISNNSEFESIDKNRFNREIDSEEFEK
jgi:FlaA1/EpsC-like NDP-sugar epimerase